MEIIFLLPLHSTSLCALYLTSWWKSGNIIHLIVSTCTAAGVRGNTSLSGSGKSLLIYNINTHLIQKKQPVYIVNAVAEGHVRNATRGSKSGYGRFIFEKGGNPSFQDCLVCIFSKLCPLFWNLPLFCLDSDWGEYTHTFTLSAWDRLHCLQQDCPRTPCAAYSTFAGIFLFNF